LERSLLNELISRNKRRIIESNCLICIIYNELACTKLRYFGMIHIYYKSYKSSTSVF
jgi:hypothetical protein